jgi:hypothetical protein
MILEIPAHIYSNTQRPIFEMFLDGPFVTPLDREIGVLELDRKGSGCTFYLYRPHRIIHVD